MTTQELQDFFTKSDFSEETKAKALAMLASNTAVDKELFDQLREIMEQELDADFKEAGVDDISAEPEAQAAEKEYIQQLDGVESELNADMAHVETELKDLEDMRQKVMKAEDLVKAKAIRESI